MNQSFFFWFSQEQKTSDYCQILTNKLEWRPLFELISRPDTCSLTLYITTAYYIRKITRYLCLALSRKRTSVCGAHVCVCV